MAKKTPSIVQIGSQYWMLKNLQVETFQDGTPISEVSSSEQWSEYAASETPGWCYYNFDESNEEEYGKLYNYYAVSASNGIAPSGFRVPTESDWNTLITATGGEKMAGFSLKNNTNWLTLNRTPGNGSNQSGFTGNPGGYFKENGEQFDFGWSANFWSTTLAGAGKSKGVRLYWQNRSAIKLDTPHGMGLSVRLIATGSIDNFDYNPALDF